MTDHNLSGSKVELDLEELINVAASAVRNTKSQMEHYESIISNAAFDASIANHNGDRRLAYTRGHMAQFYGQYLVETTKQYAAALRTHFALMECRTRPDVVVIR